MSKPVGGRIGMKAGLQRQIPEINQWESTAEPLVHENLSGGMVSEIDLANIPEKSVALLKNARVYLDKILAKPGLNSNILPTKPDSNPVLKVYSFIENGGIVRTVRFTPDGLHILAGSAWNLLTTTNPLVGGNRDRFTCAVAFDRLVFTNNGENPIQVVDFTAGDYDDLGNAPEYKYLTVFADRVIGLNLQGSSPNPIAVGWSGNADIAEWNPSNDPSAGQLPLIESPGDLNDFITGGFGFSTLLIVLRQKSIWIAEKRPVATQPLYFKPDVPGIGCGLPFTAVVGRKGVIFADHRTEEVYFYSPASQDVEPLMTPNTSLIFDGITNTDLPYGAYDPKTDRYCLAVPNESSNEVHLWVYDFKTKSAVFDGIVNLTSIDYSEASGYVLPIEALQGSIGSLLGDIGDLGITTSPLATHYYGFSTGEIAKEDSSLKSINGVDFTTVIESKVYRDRNPRNALAVNHFRFDLYIRNPVSITLYTSKDDGNTWKLRKSKNLGGSPNKVSKRFSFSKLITASRLRWKLVISGLNWELSTYVIERSTEGISVPSE